MKTILITLLALYSYSAYSIEFASTEKQAILVELFTSQGCSSCPPAEAWLGDLKDNPDLWNTYVPLAWHVDYWDYIGWKDRFAQPQFVDRQYTYRANGNIRSVYTPGLLKNGKEWRSWFIRKSLSPSKKNVGKLLVNWDEQQSQLMIDFSAFAKSSNALRYHVASLQSNLSHDINAGENHGRTLQHNFVVRQHKTVESKQARLTIPFSLEYKDDMAIAVWVSDPKTHEVIQATGTWLN